MFLVAVRFHAVVALAHDAVLLPAVAGACAREVFCSVLPDGALHDFLSLVIARGVVLSPGHGFRALNPPALQL